MKVYISGKISGENYEKVTQKFNQAAAQVSAYGYTPINPLDNGVHHAEEWNKHMAADIAMLLECEAIYLLTDWNDSKGARIEKNIAEEIGIEIMHQPEYAAFGS